MGRLGQNDEMLEAEQLNAFWLALKAAFPKVANLDSMLRLGLGVNRDEIIAGGGLDEIVLEVLVQAEAQAWTKELLLAARRRAPNNPELIDFASQVGLVPLVYQQQDGKQVSADALNAKVLQKFIKESNGMKEIVPWLKRLEKLVAQVCRIEMPANAPSTFGTGFLLGSSVVLTNNHVIQDVQAGLVQPADVVLRFDYQQMSDGATVSPGTIFHLADKWLVDCGPMSSQDLAGGVPGAEELD